jgi:hypothetical protein
MPDTLKPMTDYFVELKANMVADKAGNVVASAHTSAFKTEEEQGIDEQLAAYFRIYPNPNNGLFYLEAIDHKPVMVEVFDNAGKTVFTIDDPDQERMQIDLRKFATGVYYVNVRLEDGRSIAKKIIKE